MPAFSQIERNDALKGIKAIPNREVHDNLGPLVCHTWQGCGVGGKMYEVLG